MKLTWLGHSAFRLEFGKTVLLFDPFLKGNPTFEAAKLDFAKVTRRRHPCRRHARPRRPHRLQRRDLQGVQRRR